MSAGLEPQPLLVPDAGHNRASVVADCGQPTAPTCPELAVPGACAVSANTDSQPGAVPEARPAPDPAIGVNGQATAPVPPEPAASDTSPTSIPACQPRPPLYQNGRPVPEKFRHLFERVDAEKKRSSNGNGSISGSDKAGSPDSGEIHQSRETLHADAAVSAPASAKAGAVEPSVSSTTLGQTQNNGKIISYPKPPPERPAAAAKQPQEYPAEMAVDGDKGMTEDVLKGALLSADGLGDIEIPERENLCGTWMKQGDLGFVFGERGLGKTWLVLHFARCLAEGRDIGPWHVEKRRRVLYVDGEMPLDGMRERDASLRTTNGDLFVLNHEWTFQKANFVLNLSGVMTQKALFELCVHEQYDVLVLDNLSCLFSGMAENDADAWELVLPWLLDLRRHKIAVIIIHHSGRTGQHMRGTSKREDAAFWVLRLDSVPDHCQDSDGARFVSRFTKARQGTHEELEPLDWHFQPEGEVTRVTSRSTPTVEVFKQWIRDGLTSCTDVAEEMGISRGQVSKLAKRGEREGWLTIEHRTYKLTGAP